MASVYVYPIADRVESLLPNVEQYELHEPNQ